MIVCPKCQAKNPPGSIQCGDCGSNLLPGETAKNRIFFLVGGIILGIISAVIGYYLMTHPNTWEVRELCFLGNPIFWVFMTFAGPISGIAASIRKTPEYRKYTLRASRHREKEPDQALEDYNTAIELAPQKEKAGLVKERMEFYKSIGREEDSVKDKLTYMTMEGAYDDSASLVDAVFGGGKESYVNQSIKMDRKQLMKEGKIKGVAYCRTCKQVVELNEKLKCPIHPRAKLLNETFILPGELESTIEVVETKSIADAKKLKTRQTIILVLLGVFLTLCVIVPWIVSLFD